MDILTLDLANLSLASNKPLEEYFPQNFKIYEYSGTTDRVSKDITISDIVDWLRAKENKSFVFQCLLCRQEMSFRSVFWTADYYLNRSHLLTKKHKNNVSHCKAVGLLFNSSKKFVMCSETIHIRGNIFESMKTVARRDLPLKNMKILDCISCKDYKMYTFDRNTKTLVEFEFQEDIVKFMRIEIRPLFSFFCLFCNKNGISYTWVVQHLNSRKHYAKMGADKGAILSVRDFNIFLICCLDKLSSFLYLKHINSYLEEIVVASGGSILISGYLTKEAKPIPTNAAVSIELIPICTPKGEIKNESIKIKTRFHNFLDEPEPDGLTSSLAKSSGTCQKNVTIYEFSSNNFQEYYADNMLFLLFCAGCRIWCSRCSAPIYTLEALEHHLSSREHASRIRNNEQIGFMCHVCNVFYIELKGDMLAHVHSGFRNKQIIQALDDNNMEAICYDTPLNKSILNVYSSLFNNFSEAFKFCCLSCYDLAKKKLMYLPSHEVESKHLLNSSNILFSLCEYCNIIYIVEGEKNSHAYFLREHFATHLDIKNPINFKVWRISSLSSEAQPYDASVNSEIFKAEVRNVSREKQIKVKFSRFCSQIVHPGISYKDFSSEDLWTENKLSGSIAVLIPDKQESVLYSCLTCNRNKMNKFEMVKHFFRETVHNNSEVVYIKFCNICYELLFSTDIKVLQGHFVESVSATGGLSHIKKLLKLIDISSMSVVITEVIINDCKAVFGSESVLTNSIKSRVTEMKDVWSSKETTHKTIMRDCLNLFFQRFPNLQPHFYGSRSSGLAVEESNCDICLDVGIEKFDDVKNIFNASNQPFQVIVSLPTASVPIIRVKHIQTGIQCDISFESKFEGHCSRLIKIFIDFDERVHWLLCAIRYWAKLTHLRSTEFLSSLDINLLVLFFLMQPDVRIIPNISYVFDACNGVENILNGDFKLTWKEQRTVAKTNLDLLEGFFNYYSLINFSKHKLCPFSGHIIPRPLNNDIPLFLEDPFYKTNTLERASAEMIQKFQTMCYLTLHMPWRIM